MDHDFPKGYRPMAFCRSCGKDFAGDSLFDRHRTGDFEFNFSAEHSDGRRCMDDEEMIAAGLRPMTDKEIEASRVHNHRAGFGVQIWFDPSDAERVKKHHVAKSSN